MGLAIGPVAGGLISQNIRWGWIFLINVPVGAVTLLIGARAVRESKAPAATRNLDLPGLIASAICLFAVTFALIEGEDKGWTSPLIIAAFAVAAVAAAVFIVVEARTSNPMVDLKMFRIRQFSGGIGTTVIWAFAALGIYFFTALYIQDILGFSPTKAGLLFVPMAFALAACGGLSGLLEGWIGGHRTVAIGVAVMAGGMLVITAFGLHASFVSLLPGTMLIGAGMGLLTVPLTNSVMKATPDERAGIASALLNDSRELAGLLGITVIGAVLRGSQGAALRSGASPAQAFVDGYHDGLWVSIGLLAAGVIISYVTLRPGRKPAPAEAEGLISKKFPDQASEY
jgi:predicted MFS family arabinose efflux permease